MGFREFWWEAIRRTNTTWPGRISTLATFVGAFGWIAGKVLGISETMEAAIFIATLLALAIAFIMMTPWHAHKIYLEAHNKVTELSSVKLQGDGISPKKRERIETLRDLINKGRAYLKLMEPPYIRDFLRTLADANKKLENWQKEVSDFLEHNMPQYWKEFGLDRISPEFLYHPQPMKSYYESKHSLLESFLKTECS